jgi:hypothetical protein
MWKTRPLYVISVSLLIFICGNFIAKAQQINIPVINGSIDNGPVTATNQSPKGVAVNGSAPAGIGVQGSGLTGVSGQGSNKGTGVYGYAEDGIGLNGYGGGAGTGVHGASGYIGVHGIGNIGVYAETANPIGVALTAKGTPGGIAGIFYGTVKIDGELDTSATLNTQNINAQRLNVQSCIGCNPPSDRNLKSNFSTVSPRFILQRLSSVPIQTWNYNFESRNVRHLGPVAQDFRAAFGLGDGDKTINTVDANGVAFAAIQGLYQMIQEKDRKIDQLENRLTELERSAGKREKRGARRR